MKNLLFISTILFLLPPFVSAQTKTEYTLYLKNGSAIKCAVLNYDPANSITIQVSDGQRFDFKIEEIDSLVLAPMRSHDTLAAQSPEQLSRHPSYSEAGISFGSFIPFGSIPGGKSRLGFMIAGRLGSGMNPGFFFTFGYGNNSSSHNSGIGNAFFIALGPRFGRIDSVSGKGFSFTPIIGSLLGAEKLLGGGFAVDIHLHRNVLFNIQILASEISLVNFTISFVAR